MFSDNQISEIVKTVRQFIPTTKHYPVSVYRLNFNSSFTFSDAATVVPYLHELGITDCYASPYFKARSGSLHGYDVADQNQLSPEIGTDKEYEQFVLRLHEYNMGQILDFIPNHMSIFDNPRWLDVLENGPGSPSSRFFDIDWKPVKTELHSKVLLPILEDLYGNVLQSGRISLGFDQGAFIIMCQNHRLPVGPKTAVVILESCLGPLQEMLGSEHPDYLELQSILTASKNLPGRSDITTVKVEERQREKEIIKKRLGELYARNSSVAEVLNSDVKNFNGIIGDNSSFSSLHDLLEKQAYRLSYWRVAADEINYRRFFDVNDLVAIKMEDPVVFNETHRLIRELLLQGAVTGIRIDHVDGLFDPEDYLYRFQRACWLDSCMSRLAHNRLFKDLPQDALKEQLLRILEQKKEKERKSLFLTPLYMVVEKVLGDNERLRDTWPVDGTTGYEFLSALDRLFVDSRNKRKLINTYRKFTGSQLTFEETMYQSKNLVMRTTMSAEVNLLAHQLNRVSERSWQYRDFTLNSLRDAIREVIASFPVYRTYINAFKGLVDERDKNVINTAVNRARRRNPAVSAAIFDFIKDVLLLKYAVGMSKEGHDEQQLFVMRFQQFTGPVMAKGVEDTAFYIYNPLLSLNEVGGSPQKFGISVPEFHRQNRWRQQNMPRSFVTTSTHDCKRGEDVRARLNVISEIPAAWRAALKRWTRLNQNNKTAVNDDIIPDGSEEYYIYQTLLGTYPLYEMDKDEFKTYSERIQQHMLKAIREAKVHTSWINPVTTYEEGLSSFISNILDSKSFLADFKSFLEPVAECGIYNSISQVVLKICSPGVPDIYQGNELLAFNLTDPDNRRPVDFEQRIKILTQIKKWAEQSDNLSGLIQRLTDERQDGLIKLYITWKLLNLRREHTTLFNKGHYLGLRVTGTKRDHLCCFAWKNKKTVIIVAVPRLIAGLTRTAEIEPLGIEAWGDTGILIPANIKADVYIDIFTGETIQPETRKGKPFFRVAAVFDKFPVAVMTSNTGSSL